MTSRVPKYIENTILDDDLDAAKKVEPLRQVIRSLCGELKNAHIKRLQKRKCDIEHGFAFNDMLNNLDRIAAHCSNVAVAMIELEAADFDTHEYLKEIREMKVGSFMSDYREYDKKYTLVDEE